MSFYPAALKLHDSGLDPNSRIFAVICYSYRTFSSILISHFLLISIVFCITTELAQQYEITWSSNYVTLSINIKLIRGLIYFAALWDSKVFVIEHTTNYQFHWCSKQTAIAENYFPVEEIFVQAGSKATLYLLYFPNMNWTQKTKVIPPCLVSIHFSVAPSYWFVNKWY